MDYGTGAIFGCPAHDQRDLDFARKYDLPVMPVVLPAGGDAASFAVADIAYTDAGTIFNSGFLDGLSIDDAKKAVAGSFRRPQRRWPAAGHRSRSTTACATGACRASAIGAPHPDHPLRGLRHHSRAQEGPAGRAARRCHLRQARQCAGPSPDLEACPLPAMRRRGAARNRHHGHLRRFVLVLRPLHRARMPRRRPFPTSPIAGCRSTSISAASSTRSCTCSIRASSPAP